MKNTTCHPGQEHRGLGLCAKCYGRMPQRLDLIQKNNWRKQGIKITLLEYARLLEKQKGKCAICDTYPKKKRLAVDHDHETGQIRGLLCGTCNRSRVPSVLYWKVRVERYLNNAVLKDA